MSVMMRENHSFDFSFFLIKWSDYINHYASGRPCHLKRVKEEHIIPLTKSEKNRLNPPIKDAAIASEPANSILDYFSKHKYNVQEHQVTICGEER